MTGKESEKLSIAMADSKSISYIDQKFVDQTYSEMH